MAPGSSAQQSGSSQSDDDVCGSLPLCDPLKVCQLSDLKILAAFKDVQVRPPSAPRTPGRGRRS